MADRFRQTYTKPEQEWKEKGREYRPTTTWWVITALHLEIGFLAPDCLLLLFSDVIPLKSLCLCQHF